MATELLLSAGGVDGAPPRAVVFGRDCMARVEAQVSPVVPSRYHFARPQGNVNEFCLHFASLHFCSASSALGPIETTRHFSTQLWLLL